MSTPISNSVTSGLVSSLLSPTSAASASPAISFGGLVSGLNTQSVIQGLLAGDQASLNLLQTQQSNEQAKLQAWQDLNAKLQALQVAASTLSLQATSGAKQVSFGGPSGTFATGTASSSALNGTFSLKIDQLATATTVTSTAGIGTAITGSDIVTSTPKTATAITAGTFSVDGQQITINPGDSFSTVLSNIQSVTTAAGDPVVASIVGNTIQLTRPSGNTNPISVGSAGDTSNFLSVTKLLGQPSGVTVTSGGPVGVANPTAVLDSANIPGLTSTTSGSLLINGVSISYNTTTDSLNDVMNRINASSAGVTASYDPNSDTVTLTSNQTGNLGISLSDSSGNLFGQLNLTASGAQHLGNVAQYEVNGGSPQYSASNSINNIVPGVNVTLQATTPSGQPLSVSVSQDSSVAVSAMQSFVSAYNNVVDTIQQDTAFDPNTNTAGILLGDPIVESLQMQLNDALFISNGASLGLASGYQDVTAIGITTGPIGSAPGTTTDLQFDSSVFQNALGTNPTAVINLATTVFGNFNKMALNLTAPGGEIDNAIQSENSQIQDYQSQINDQQLYIQQQQQMLNDEFTQMEQMLAEIQSQSATGASALASLGSSSSTTSSTTSSSTGSAG